MVDNQSTDKTVKKASNWEIKLVEIHNFRPGLAINEGIRASTGEIIVILSGHCIPTDSLWLENLVRPLAERNIAGVYGRQQPMAFSNAIDKRDLCVNFGLDNKLQVKDPFSIMPIVLC